MDPINAETHQDEPDRLAETVDLTIVEGRPGTRPAGGPPDPTSEGADPSAPGRPVEVVTGTADFSEEMRELLRLRLRAAGIVLLTGFGLYFARELLISEAGPLRRLHLMVVAVQAGAVWLLSTRRDWPIDRLRFVEAVMFASALAYFSALQYHVTSLRIVEGDSAILDARSIELAGKPATARALVDAAAGLVSTIKGTVIYTFMLIVLYGLFVPNTWRRAAVAIGLFVLTTGAVQAAVLVRTAGQRALVEAVTTLEFVSDHALILLTGALIAVYGSHIINVLRLAAFRARRLNQYILRRPIGSGGMGEVYLAEHRLLKRPCAIKLIRPDRAGDPSTLRRFEHEVRTAARLSHWNTIEIYDYGRTEDGTFYHVMEYLRGLGLDALVARHGPLPPGRAVYLLRQACDSLAEAHAAGLVHRDLKPANLFAAVRGGQFDVTKVLDFGLVKTIGPEPIGEDGRREVAVTGTPLYMSPEQAMGDPLLGPRSDLFALGAVAYFLLVGRPPHSGSTPVMVMNAVVREPVIPPSQLRPEVPADLERIVMRCLAKRPLDRFGSAEELGAAFASCSCATEWNAKEARRWWLRYHPEVLEDEPAS